MPSVQSSVPIGAWLAPATRTSVPFDSSCIVASASDVGVAGSYSPA